MADESDYFRAYASDVGLNPLVGGVNNVQDALAAAGGIGLTAVETHLSTVRIGTAFSAPTVLVPAPGMGFVTQVVQAFIEFVAGDPADSHYDDAFAVYYGAGEPTTDAITTNSLSAAIDTVPSASAIGYSFPQSAGAFRTLRSVAENAAVVFSAAHDPVTVGPIVTATIADGGGGYAPGDTGTIISNYTGDNSATYVVDTVGALGVITAFTVVVAGTAYETFDNPQLTAVTTGAGDGTFTVNVTAIPATVGGEAYVTIISRPLALH